MKTAARIASAFLLMAAFVALAVAADRRESRPLAGFNAIALSAPIKVEVTQGEAETLALEGDEAALADLETVVEQGVLHIRTRSRIQVAGMSKVRARVGAKALEALRISGSGDIVARELRAQGFRIAVSGSGDVRIGALTATRVEVAVSGSGDVTVGGRADFVSTSIAGSGDVNVGKLEAREAKVSIAGSGDATLWARESLNVSIVGSGDVRYYGDPAVKRSVVGAGSVRRAGATPS